MIQSQNRENYIVVKFLDLDPKKITFGEEEKSEHGFFTSRSFTMRKHSW